ncbi:transcription elongation regulator [Chytridiales sp. JEL 0842]|nr:transcription elongation regulator [Chytridiales sp. JEL 0842]
MQMPIQQPPPPPQWTQHVGPNGLKYYYNNFTKQSTWEKPADFNPPPPPPPPPLSGMPIPPMQNHNMQQQAAPEEVHVVPDSEHGRELKERVAALKKLPNTTWAIVLTTLENEFFYNFETKERTWDIPEEIGELVGQIMAEPGYEEEFQEEEEVPDEGGALEEERQEQFEQPQGGCVLEKKHENVKAVDMAFQGAALAGEKRKVQDEDDAANVDGGNEAKKVKHEEPVVSLVNLTTEQKHHKFLDLLREKDVSPFGTWEKEVQKIIDDPRFELIATPKERKYLFDKYCKLIAAEKKQQTLLKSQSAKETFSSLVTEKVLDFRTSYDDFARKHRKDPKFVVITSEADRKSLYKDTIAKLKQAEMDKKKAERKRKEDSFFAMLKAVKKLHENSIWKDIKPYVEKDERYLAVPTPIEREDLFRSYIKELRTENELVKSQQDPQRLREIQALEERQNKVQMQKMQLRHETQSQRSRLFYDESLTTFRTLLVDLVRTHNTNWEDALGLLQSDPRFGVDLKLEEKQRLFDEHVGRLFEKVLTGFGEMIEERTMLKSEFGEIEELCDVDPRAQKLAKGKGELKRLFNQHQANRIQRCKEALQRCLEENQFLTFHVKSAVQNVQVQAVAKGLKEPEEGEEWRLINLEEIKNVLKEDKRYNDYKEFETERERIVFTYLKGLVEAAKAEKGGTLDRTIARHAGGEGGVESRK